MGKLLDEYSEEDYDGEDLSPVIFEGIEELLIAQQQLFKAIKSKNIERIEKCINSMRKIRRDYKSLFALEFPYHDYPFYLWQLSKETRVELLKNLSSFFSKLSSVRDELHRVMEKFITEADIIDGIQTLNNYAKARDEVFKENGEEGGYIYVR